MWKDYMSTGCRFLKYSLWVPKTYRHIRGHEQTLNSQPTVGVVESLKSLLLKRSARLDFPTPELPSSTSFTLRVFGIGLWSWAPFVSPGWLSSIKIQLWHTQKEKELLLRKLDLFFCIRTAQMCWRHLVWSENKSKTKVQSGLVKRRHISAPLPGAHKQPVVN